MAELKSTTISGPLSGTSATFSGDLTIDTNTLYVDSTNNKVGIRNASPLNLFDVKGAIFTGSYATSAGARFHDNVYGINFGGIDASSVGVIQGSAFEVGAANIALQPNGGNVGIGTASPTALLNTYSATTATQIIVTGADTTNQRLEVTDGTVTNRFGIFGRTNGDAGVLGTQTNHALLLQTNATTRLTIASTGAATFSGNIVQSGTSNIIQQSASNSYTGGSVLDIYNISATGYGIYVQGGGTSQYSLSVNNYAGTNLLTILGSGAATFSSSVKATTGFNSLTDTIGVANVTWVTIYNIPATQAAEGVYNVYAHYNDDSGGMAFTQILADRTHLREINNSDGATVLIQLSGRNIQVYQSYGTTVNIDWSILIQKLR